MFFGGIMGIFDFFKKNKNSAHIEVEEKTVDIEESKIIEEKWDIKLVNVSYNGTDWYIL